MNLKMIAFGLACLGLVLFATGVIPFQSDGGSYERHILTPN